MSEAHPLIQIVDEHDVPLRGGTMDEAQLSGLWHRIASIMVQDRDSGEFLVQKIAANPYYNGGKWNLTASGHVDEGETYEETAMRELFEEMGIRGLQLIEFSYYQTEKQDHRAGRDRVYRRYNQVFIAYADKAELEISPRPQEVEDWAWMRLDQLFSDDIPKVDKLARFVQDYEKEQHMLSKERGLDDAIR
ncbi:MAG: NUDIX hydrolase [Sphaerimonospora mesophila]